MVVVIWGFNFVAVTLVIEGMSPFMMLTIRFLLVAMILLPFYPKPPIPIKQILIVAITFGFLHVGSMFWSIHMGLNASVGIVVDQVGVPFSILLAFIFFKEKPSATEITGIIFATIGTFILAGTPNSIGNPVAFMLMVGTGFFWALYSIELKKFNSPSPLGLVAWVSLFSCLISLVLSLIFEENQISLLRDATSANWIALSYTVIFASILAHGTWAYTKPQIS